jgi:hypothetical protein
MHGYYRTPDCETLSAGAYFEVSLVFIDVRRRSLTFVDHG